MNRIAFCNNVRIDTAQCKRSERAARTHLRERADMNEYTHS